MKKLLASEVVPGMKLGQDIAASTGAVLMPAGSILTEKAIDSFENWNVDQVSIIEESDQEISKRQEEEQKFKETYNTAVTNVMDLMDRLEEAEELNSGELRGISEDLSEFTRDYSYIKLFNELGSKDKRAYQHSINVGIFSSLLARWLGYDNAIAKELVLTGVLHDIGKVKLPKDILYKETPLSEEEEQEFQKHPEYGYELITANTNFNENVARGILEHHELLSGKGYPQGKEGYEIHIYGKIVAITNVFDKIINQQYKNGYENFTFQDLQTIAGNTRDYDLTIAKTFVNHIYNLFSGSRVILSNANEAEIVMVYKNEITRPLVKLDNGEFLDLSKERSVKIDKVLEI